MSADEFLDKCSSSRDFDEAYNLEIKVVDTYGFIFEKNSNLFQTGCQTVPVEISSKSLQTEQK
jgi:hypothetical protein